LRTIRLFYSFLLFCCVWLSTADAATPSPKGKKAFAASTSKAKSGKTSTSKRTTARRSEPRQTAPTAERYREIQQALADKGYYSGPVNGEWGPDSVTALKNFQEANKLTADGKLGSLSLIALGLGPKRESMNQMAGKPEPTP